TTPGQRRYVYETHELSDGVWSDPVKVTGGPSDASQQVNSQAFVTLDGSEIYWSGFSTDCPAVGCIYKAPSAGNGTWGAPSVVLAPAATATSGDVIALGEASLTADGHYLYFAYILFGGGTSYDLNIGVVEKP
ncbi:MAG TPA: hypothetical protein VMV18_03350, partial [bacterium]|nr:hypothetical protein [bacterium]